MTNRICLVDNRIDEYNVFMNSVLPNVYSIMIDINTTCMSDVMTSIQNLQLASIDSIAYIAHAAFEYTIILNDLKVNISDVDTFNTLIEFLIYMKSTYNLNYFDFLGCGLASNDNWLNCFDFLNSKSNVNIRASTDDTGNLNAGGDWILEMGNVDANALYFNSNIANFTKLLDSNIINSEPFDSITTVPTTTSTDHWYVYYNSYPTYPLTIRTSATFPTISASTQFIQYNSYSIPYGNTAYLVSPVFTIPTGIQYITLKFNFCNDSGASLYADCINIGLITNSNLSNYATPSANNLVSSNLNRYKASQTTPTFNTYYVSFMVNNPDLTYNMYIKFTSTFGYRINIDTLEMSIDINKPTTIYPFTYIYTGLFLDSFNNQIYPSDITTVGSANFFYTGVDVNNKAYSSSTKPTSSGYYQLYAQLSGIYSSNKLYISLLINNASIAYKYYETFDSEVVVATTTSTTNWYVYYNSYTTYPLTKWTSSTSPTISAITRFIQYNSYSIPSGNTAYLASPVFTVSSGTQYITLTFDFCNDSGISTTLDRINIGLITNSTLANYATPSATNLLSSNLNRYRAAQTTPAFNKYNVSFRVNNTELAYNMYIKFTSAYGNWINIDNLVISNSSSTSLTTLTSSPSVSSIIPTEPTQTTELSYVNSKTIADLKASIPTSSTSYITGGVINIYSDSAKTTNLTSSTVVLSTYNYVASTTTAVYYISQTVGGVESYITSYSMKLSTAAPAQTTALSYDSSKTITDLKASIPTSSTSYITGGAINIYSDSAKTTNLTSFIVALSSYNYVASTKTAVYYVSQTINGVESPLTLFTLSLYTVLPTIPSQVTIINKITVSDTLTELTSYGSNIKCYSTNTSNIELEQSANLLSGTYYFSQSINNVESDRIPISLLFITSPPIVSATLNVFSNSFVSDFISQLTSLTPTAGLNLKIYLPGATSNLDNLEATVPILNQQSYNVTQTLNGIESAPVSIFITLIKSASSCGDPYITTFSGLKYKLPNILRTYRLLEYKLNNNGLEDKLIINASVSELAQPEKQDIINRCAEFQGITNPLLNGFFYDKFYVGTVNSYIILNRQLKIIKSYDINRFRIIVQNDIKTFHCSIQGKSKYQSKFILLDGVKIEFRRFANPQILNGIDVSVVSTENAIGILNSNINPKYFSIKSLENTKPLKSLPSAVNTNKKNKNSAYNKNTKELWFQV